MRSSAAGKAKKNKFAEKVIAIIRKIPRGKVLSYGQVAALAGIPRAARMVGGILFRQGPGHRLPWQRVVNAQGGLSTYRVGFGEKQRALLQAEGLRFNREGKLDLKKYQWWPSPSQLKKMALSEELAAIFQGSMRL